jgi:hypothetical protein
LFAASAKSDHIVSISALRNDDRIAILGGTAAKPLAIES